jgi:hypothetical protein
MILYRLLRLEDLVAGEQAVRLTEMEQTAALTQRQTLAQAVAGEDEKVFRLGLGGMAGQV